MRFFTLSSVLLGGLRLASSFPTADNVARLARAGGLEIPEELSYAEIVQVVKRHQERRLLVNPLDQPIEGMDTSAVYAMNADNGSGWRP